MLQQVFHYVMDLLSDHSVGIKAATTALNALKDFDLCGSVLLLSPTPFPGSPPVPPA